MALILSSWSLIKRSESESAWIFKLYSSDSSRKRCKLSWPNENLFRLTNEELSISNFVSSVSALNNDIPFSRFWKMNSLSETFVVRLLLMIVFKRLSRMWRWFECREKKNRNSESLIMPKKTCSSNLSLIRLRNPLDILPLGTHHLSKSRWMASIWVSHCRYRIVVDAYHKFLCPQFLSVIFHVKGWNGAHKFESSVWRWGWVKHKKSWKEKRTSNNVM